MSNVRQAGPGQPVSLWSERALAAQGAPHRESREQKRQGEAQIMGRGVKEPGVPQQPIYVASEFSPNIPAIVAARTAERCKEKADPDSDYKRNVWPLGDSPNSHRIIIGDACFVIGDNEQHQGRASVRNIQATLNGSHRRDVFSGDGQLKLRFIGFAKMSAEVPTSADGGLEHRQVTLATGGTETITNTGRYNIRIGDDIYLIPPAVSSFPDVAVIGHGNDRFVLQTIPGSCCGVEDLATLAETLVDQETTAEQLSNLARLFNQRNPHDVFGISQLVQGFQCDLISTGSHITACSTLPLKKKKTLGFNGQAREFTVENRKVDPVDNSNETSTIGIVDIADAGALGAAVKAGARPFLAGMLYATKAIAHMASRKSALRVGKALTSAKAGEQFQININM